jgi:hypothetical protein
MPMPGRSIFFFGQTEPSKAKAMSVEGSGMDEDT